MQGNKIHLKHAMEGRYFLLWAPFSTQSAAVNILADVKEPIYILQVSRWPLLLTHRWLRQA